MPSAAPATCSRPRWACRNGWRANRWADPIHSPIASCAGEHHFDWGGPERSHTRWPAASIETGSHHPDSKNGSTQQEKSPHADRLDPTALKDGIIIIAPTGNSHSTVTLHQRQTSNIEYAYVDRRGITLYSGLSQQ